MSAAIEQDNLDNWRSHEALAERMIPLIGALYREHDVILYCFGRKLARESAVGILRAHRFARQITGHELLVTSTFPLIEAMSGMDLDSAKIDVGKLAADFTETNDDIATFLTSRLSDVMTGNGRLLSEPTDVVLYGFGRIGRLLTRILIDRVGSGAKLRLRAIVLRPGGEEDLLKRASLLRRDSIHGPFDGTITVDQENSRIIANGNPIQIIYANSPAEIDYTSYGIDNAIVVDNTGSWRDEEGLSKHLESTGVSRVLLTAPGKGDLKNIIFGVNHGTIEDSDRIISAASCTTNAIVPVLKVMSDTFGINSGHVETVHSYTNDQNLTDNFHKKERRGRSAPLNMVITETGAAKAVVKALPELAGKLTGNAIRVPTPNVSLAILNLNLGQATNKEALNARLREASLSPELREQIDFTASVEVVSSDLVGAERASIVDSAATIVDGDRAVLYVWYDNEAGYSYQVVRVIQHLAGLLYPLVG
ncbi:MAG: glyceraldehyde 3-phosphate dehydrogenase [Verrucomicrobiales bacterium]|jgi:glyceraldehyde 3-phosphate dehydrogenase